MHTYRSAAGRAAGVCVIRHLFDVSVRSPSADAHANTDRTRQRHRVQSIARSLGRVQFEDMDGFPLFDVLVQEHHVPHAGMSGVK